jgi:hypothetical protein
MENSQMKKFVTFDQANRQNSPLLVNPDAVADAAATLSS